MEPTSGAAPVSSFLPVPAPDRDRSFFSLLGLSLRRGGGQRSIQVVVLVLALAGVSMVAFPALTDVFNKYQQTKVPDRLGEPAYQQLWKQHRIKVGQGLTRLIIDNDRVNVNVLVVEGTTLAALEAGAGHYIDTPFPCEQGNVAIAGHRTTYGRPFNKLNYMHAGDTVDLLTPFARCTYRVIRPFDGHDNPWVVQPNSYSVVGQQGVLGTGHWLTLTSCNPLGSDAQRIILRLELVKKTPITSKASSS